VGWLLGVAVELPINGHGRDIHSKLTLSLISMEAAAKKI
jgi:hypothetical protein